MPLALFEGEKLYKIISLNTRLIPEMSHLEPLFLRMVFIEKKDGKLRVVSTLRFDDLDNTDESEVPSPEYVEKFMLDIGSLFEKINIRPDVFDFSALSDVDKQLDAMMKIPALEDLAILLKCRRRWIPY